MRKHGLHLEQPGKICTLNSDTRLEELTNEKLYENALVIALSQRGQVIEQQREFPVYYRGHYIGKLVPDLILDRRVIVDPKVVTAFHENHIAQMLGYLNITGLEVALLLNFKETKLTWKRIVTRPRR